MKQALILVLVFLGAFAPVGLVDQYTDNTNCVCVSVEEKVEMMGDTPVVATYSHFEVVATKSYQPVAAATVSTVVIGGLTMAAANLPTIGLVRLDLKKIQKEATRYKRR